MQKQNLKLFIFLAIFFMWPGFVSAATLYMGAGETYTNLRDAMDNMNVGDTLIIRDGTYNGVTNQVDNSYHPPISNALWTTIKAEHDGAVLFDGEGQRDMFSVNLSAGENSALVDTHWQFEGINWGRASSSVVQFGNISHVKFLRCGGFDAGSGNTSVFFAARSSYILFDGCYAWGNGRSMMTAWTSDYNNDHIIMRNCVGRIDSTDSGPIYTFGMYAVNHGLIQNCIAIDNDQDSFYNAASERSGGFSIPSTDHDANDINVHNSVILNSDIGGLFTTANTYSTYDVGFYNSVVFDITKNPEGNLNSFRGTRNIIDHVTFAEGLGGYIGLNAWPWTGSPNDGVNMTNSIVANYTGSSNGTIWGMAGDYQAFYSNSSPLSADSTPLGTHSKTTTNPIWNASTNPTGALKYITRIESGSTLSGQGSLGSDIGANLNTLRGTTGTLWGEEGYDTDTGIPMWPYPNEDLIKTKMNAYTGGGVNGARGFAASGKQLNGIDDITLTSYIWEYLGNQIPAEIYGDDEIAPASPTGLGVI